MACIEQNVLKIEYLKVEFSEIIGREVTKPINYQWIDCNVITVRHYTILNIWDRLLKILHFSQSFKFRLQDYLDFAFQHLTFVKILK